MDFQNFKFFFVIPRIHKPSQGSLRSHTKCWASRFSRSDVFGYKQTDTQTDKQGMYLDWAQSYPKNLRTPPPPQLDRAPQLEQAKGAKSLE